MCLRRIIETPACNDVDPIYPYLCSQCSPMLCPMKRFLPLLFLFLPLMPYAQVVYEDINNKGIYDFLDELANLRVIELNSVVKPYSRQFIAEKLVEAKEYVSGFKFQGSVDKKSKKRYLLNKRQVRELEFYLQDYQLDLPCGILKNGVDGGGAFQSFSVSGFQGFNVSDFQGEKRSEEKGLSSSGNDDALNLDSVSRIPDRGSGSTDTASDCCLAYDHKLGFLFKKNPAFAVPLSPLAFQYKDKLFTFSLRPILGVAWMTNENAAEYHRWWGGSMFGYIGKNFGFYANLRDNDASTAMAKPAYFTLEQGQVYKNMGNGRVNYSEMRGGIVASVSWGSIGIVNDRVMWGDNYHGANILSGKAPAFPSIQLHLNPAKWFDFSYMHGWLNSNVVDSSRSYTVDGVYRTVFRNKYIAANMFTFIPWRGLNISFGNSIIYTDVSVNPLYLIPFLFYNAVDASKNNYSNDGGSNSQMFFNISSRQIRHLNLFVSLFIDELKASRITDPALLNFTSWKAGLALSGYPIRNLTFMAEWTKTNPMTYKHYIATTTYASNDYCLGHYLRDNSMEIYLALQWKPIRGLTLKASGTLAQHGTDLPYSYDKDYQVDGVPFLGEKVWENQELAIMARYEYINNAFFFLEYSRASHAGDVQYNPAFLHGTTDNFTIGLNLGF